MADVIRSTLDGSLDKLPKAMTSWKACIHKLLFLLMLGNDIADLISDWLFFTDVAIAEKGLVYGPPEPAVMWLLLFFSIIGTATFFVECINLWWESFRNNPWVDSDYLSAVVIWIEDLPQVILSLCLVLCREEPISIFQLAKAAVVLIGVIIRIVITSVKYCNKEAVRSHHHVKLKVAIMLGIILESCCAGAIFFLTQTERNNLGEVAFRVPSTVIEEMYNDNRYFNNTGLYMHNPDFLPGKHLHPDSEVVEWLRLAPLLTLISGRTAFLKMEYEHTPANILNLAISEKPQEGGNWTLSECYSRNQTNEVANISCSQLSPFINSTIILIKLEYERPGTLFKKKVFGDIRMNIKKQHNDLCTEVSSYADSVQKTLAGQNSSPFIFHYYRTNVTLKNNDTKFLLYEAGMPRFYRNVDSDLIDTTVDWKTGWKECESKGHRAPIYDQSLELPCT